MNERDEVPELRGTARELGLRNCHVADLERPREHQGTQGGLWECT